MKLPKCRVTYRYKNIDTRTSGVARRYKTIEGDALERFIIESPSKDRVLVAIERVE
jgi:hypothetical protein